ncbi:MAG: prepilin-type N-terminal cleavage/methylation domain-containing protein [Planctomycetes bacterium]|nr:prepilin-type N-terminal cleavage/methylation domain-containing protein [Planctomycetota bacterium]
MRRAFTLIELLAVTTIASVIFTVLSVSIFALHRTHTRVQSDAHTATALADFARRLRADAHAATAARLESLEAENPVLALELEDGRQVEYAFHAERPHVERRLHRGEDLLHRDTFILPRGAEVNWTSPEEDAPQLVTAIVSRPMSRDRSGVASRRRTRIEAAVGLDQQYGGSPP